MQCEQEQRYKTQFVNFQMLPIQFHNQGVEMFWQNIKPEEKQKARLWEDCYAIYKACTLFIL